jgi:signal transduction histidine kinase
VKRRILTATTIVVVTTLVVGIAAALFVRVRVQRTAAEELSRQARVTARLLDEDLSDVRLGRSGDLARELVRYRSALERSLERARILGGHDVVEAVLTVRGNDIPIGEPLVALPAASRANRTGEIRSVDVEGKTMLVAVERVELATGTLAVAIGRTEPLFPVRWVFWSLVVALAVGAALTIGLATWFSRSLSGRLRRIGVAAARVGDGDLAARADDEGDDEIAEVAAAFNEMADDLEATRNRERHFLMAVGHDLRTPLTTIRGYAEALDAGDVDRERLPDVAAALHRQTDQLARLIEDVSLLARIEASEFTLKPEPVELVGLVEETVEAYRRSMEMASIALVVEGRPPVSTVLDPDRLRQVIGNLMDNALRYTPEGGSVTVGVVREGDAGDGEVTVHVGNTGPAIRPDDLPHVFERLYVADRYRAERPSGSGLGLSIVSELVGAMGGTVTCVSEPAVGTVFTVRLGGEDVRAP